MAEEDDTVELGGNIVLNGFKEVDGGSMIIVKKIVGQYVKALSEKNDKFEQLVVNMKQDNGYSISADLQVDGNTKNSEGNHNNLFMALDACMKGLD